MRQAKVFRNGELVGILSKSDEDKYQFSYTLEYLGSKNPKSISVNLPLQEEAFYRDTLFPFFFNLLSEGSTKDMQCRELKIDPNDHFSRLLKTTAQNTIGSITVEEIVV